MHTRLGPGRGKVFDQVKVWSGFVADDDTSLYWRQVALKYVPEASWSITVLGSNLKADVIVRIKIEGQSTLKQRFELMQRNVRILDDTGEYFQSADGVIYQCKSFFISLLKFPLEHYPSCTRIRKLARKTFPFS